MAVIIVNWNVSSFLRENLHALAASQTNGRIEVIVVDNASTDDSCAMIEREVPWVQLIRNQENMGFARACNQGIAASRGRHVLLLNPDMRVTPDALAKTIAYADKHSDEGVFSALLLRNEAQPLLSVRRFPTFWSQFFLVTKIAKIFPSVLAYYEARDIDLRQEQAVDSVRGAFLCIPEKTLRALGGLDERYFLWFEDVDYCRRVVQSGRVVRHVPSIEVYDAFGRSFAQRSMVWKQRQIFRSMIRYFETWMPWPQTLVLRTVCAFMLVLVRLHQWLGL